MSTHPQRSGNKEQFWRRMVRGWRRSGLSVRAFCARHRLAAPTFYAWRRTLAQHDAVPPAPAPAFLPVQVTNEPRAPHGRAAAAVGTTPALEVVLTSGRRLRVGVGFDGPTLRRLVALLEEGERCC